MKAVAVAPHIIQLAHDEGDLLVIEDGSRIRLTLYETGSILLSKDEARILGQFLQMAGREDGDG